MKTYTVKELLKVQTYCLKHNCDRKDCKYAPSNFRKGCCWRILTKEMGDMHNPTAWNDNTIENIAKYTILKKLGIRK